MTKERLVAGIAVTAIVVGAAVLVSWWLSLPGLKTLHPVLGGMSPYAAFCFVLTGVALWSLRASSPGLVKRWAGHSSAAIVVLIALLALASPVFGWAPGGVLETGVGRILPVALPVASAIAFLSLGAGLLLLNVEVRGWRPTEFLAFIAMLLALLALIAFAYNFISIFPVPARRALAFHSVALLVGMAFALLIARPEGGLMRLATGDSAAGIMVRGLLPAALAIPVLLGWLVTEGQRAGWYPPGLSLSYYAMSNLVVFSGLILHTAFQLHRTDTLRHRAEERIHLLNAELEERVAQRTAELEAANKELEAFSYSVSHDLRAPLRAIDGFSRILVDDYPDQLGVEGAGHLQRVRLATQRMGELIDALLSLSRVSRSDLRRTTVDLSRLARTVAAEIRQRDNDVATALTIEPGLNADADPSLLEAALENLLSNAWKFTRRSPSPQIQIGALRENGAVTYFVRDNGVGFDMTYAHKLFGAFQRLHGQAEFGGTGIGLATVQRIVHRHGGQIWAEAALNQGATFFFTLGPGRVDPHRR